MQPNLSVAQPFEAVQTQDVTDLASVSQAAGVFKPSECLAKQAKKQHSFTMTLISSSPKPLACLLHSPHFHK